MDLNFFLELEAIVGTSNVLRDTDLSAYEKPWRGSVSGKAAAVIKPKTTSELAAVVTACVAHNVAIVPQGGNTGLVGGSIPDQSGDQVVIQLGRMSVVREIDAQNMTVTVEAGCILSVLQSAVKNAGFLFPLSLGAEGSCMIGGNLATNAGGTQVIRYGNARDLCLGLEVVTPKGEILNVLSGLRKDNTGYDLRDLYIGSEGTLGIIATATLKIFPLPVSVLTSWVTINTIDEAIRLLDLARKRFGQALTSFEIMNHSSLELVKKNLPQIRIPFSENLPAFSLLIEIEDFESEQHGQKILEDFFEDAVEFNLGQEIIIAENLSQSLNFWDIREHIPVAQRMDGYSVAHDVSVPISGIALYVSKITDEIKKTFPASSLIILGHLGDGNLHVNVTVPNDQAPPNKVLTDSINKIIYDHAMILNGSFSAEHGIGFNKLNALITYKDPIALSTMRLIKQALDPMNIMNPNRLLDHLL